MTPAQAAKLIGCHVMHVRLLIRSGKLPAVRKPADRNSNKHGWEYDIERKDALKIKRKKSKRGRPRGSTTTKPEYRP